MKIARCQKCHTQYEMPLNDTHILKCYNCGEKKFINYYEHVTEDSVELKGGNEMAKKESEIIEKKETPKAKPTVVERVSALMDKKTPEEIAKIISDETRKRCTAGRIKATIAYIQNKQK